MCVRVSGCALYHTGNFWTNAPVHRQFLILYNSAFSGPSMYMNNIPVNKRYLAYLASFSHLATLRQVFEFICMRLRLRLEETRLWLYKDDVSNLFIKVFVTHILHFELNRNFYLFFHLC